MTAHIAAQRPIVTVAKRSRGWLHGATRTVAPPHTFGPLTSVHTSFTLPAQATLGLGSTLKYAATDNTHRTLSTRKTMPAPHRQRKNTASSENRQSERFPIRVQVRYRAFGENDWHLGTTENISAAGVFFRSNESAELHKHVELDFVLRSGQNESIGTRVVCLGEIVRTEMQTEARGLCILAAKIEDYRLLPWRGPVM